MKLTNQAKNAILGCFANTAWISGDGQTYIDALRRAFYPLVSISAVYTQSGTVYDMDDLDSLKSDLVVTALYADSTTEVLADSDYTLSGTLTAGTSTITVTYESKTTTFNVTVTASNGWRYTPSMGLLSAQSFVDSVSGSLSYSETIVDDYLHIVSSDAATSNNVGFSFTPVSFSNNASYKIQIRINETAGIATGNTSSMGNFTFRLSNGSSGANFGFGRNGTNTANVILRYMVGSTATKLTSHPLTTGEWHIIEAFVESNKVSIKIDGETAVSNANLATQYTIANRMYLFGNASSATYPTNVDIKLIEYREF